MPLLMLMLLLLPLPEFLGGSVRPSFVTMAAAAAAGDAGRDGTAVLGRVRT